MKHAILGNSMHRSFYSGHSESPMISRFFFHLFLAVPLVTCLYLLVNVSYFTVLSPAALVASEAAAVTFAEKAFPQIAWTIPLFVAASCIGELMHIG